MSSAASKCARRQPAVGRCAAARQNSRIVDRARVVTSGRPREFPPVIVDVDAEPGRIAIGCSLYVATHLLWADPCVAIRLAGIGPDLTAVEASETVDNLMLDQAVVEFGTIADNEKGHERAGNSHFLHQAPPRRSIHLLSRPRVAAARVSPQTAGMIFVGVPAL